MHVLKPVIRDYAWGSPTLLADLQGREPTGRPEAELWLGDHPGAPCVAVVRDGAHVGLDEVVVAGDTGNDAAMFALKGVRGIIPANGFDELRLRFSGSGRVYEARSQEADGVVEGLRHWMAERSRD